MGHGWSRPGPNVELGFPYPRYLRNGGTPEPEDPGSSPGGPATRERLGVIVRGALSLTYYNSLRLTAPGIRLAPQGLRWGGLPGGRAQGSTAL